jgi:hypothetical protein
MIFSVTLAAVAAAVVPHFPLLKARGFHDGNG